MPTYSYRCDACGHTFEQVQRITETPTRECPSCHAQQARRMITSANFILKGSGWYSDLYSGGSNKKGSGGDAAPVKPSTDSASTSSDAAPAAAATPAASAPAAAPAASAPAPSTSGSSSSST